MGRQNALFDISMNRVLATVFIVICHIIKFYDVVPGHQMFGQFFNVGVPMFIIISGYLYGLKSSVGGAAYNYTFYIKRLLKVSLPVQIFSLILLVIGLINIRDFFIYFFNLQGIGFIIDTHMFACSHYISQTWFVTVILICYLILPIIYRIESKRRNTFSYLLMLFFVTMLTYFGLYLGLLLLFAYSYHVGLWKIERRFKIITLVCVMIAFALTRVIGKLYFDNTVFYNHIISMVSSYGLAMSIMLTIKELYISYPRFSELQHSSFFRFIDKYSFYIYVTHYCVIPFTYEKYNTSLATLLFIGATIFLSVVLELIHKLVERVVLQVIKV